MRKLYPYQHAVLRWALPRDKIALFLEMRLGKTLITIRWALAKGCNRILVVAPVSVLNAWEDELRQEGQQWDQVRGYSAEPNFSSRWTLTTYQTLRENQALLNSLWDCVVLDESYSIANPKAKISKVILSKFKHIQYKALLTGCPAPESLLNYYQQMSFLYGRWMGVSNYWQHRSKHFWPSYGGFGWHPAIGTAPLLAEQVAMDSYELKRHQAGVGSKKVYHKHLIPMAPKLKEAYTQLEEEWLLGDQETKWAVVRHTWLHRLAGGYHPESPSEHKTKTLVSLLEKDLRGEQVVIWFRFLDEMHAVTKLIKGESICGADSIQKRKAATTAFQEGQIQFLCCIMGCFRYGVNLSAADTEIYYSNQWDYNSRKQSEDRIIDTSPKSNRHKLVIDLITEGTIDEDVYKALREDKPISTRLPITERVQQLLRERVRK